MAYSDEERDEIVAHVLVNVATGRFVSRIFREDETTAGTRWHNPVSSGGKVNVEVNAAQERKARQVRSARQSHDAR